MGELPAGAGLDLHGNVVLGPAAPGAALQQKEVETDG
jgi:hypothetical protein